MSLFLDSFFDQTTRAYFLLSIVELLESSHEGRNFRQLTNRYSLDVAIQCCQFFRLLKSLISNARYSNVLGRGKLQQCDSISFTVRTEDGWNVLSIELSLTGLTDRGKNVTIGKNIDLATAFLQHYLCSTPTTNLMHKIKIPSIRILYSYINSRCLLSYKLQII